MNFGKMEEEYFCAEGWTGVIELELRKKIAVSAQRISRSREFLNRA
jgi:hypothetical protein